MLSQPCFTPLCVPQGYSWNVTLEKVERKLKIESWNKISFTNIYHFLLHVFVFVSNP